MDIIIKSGADLSTMFEEGGLLKQLTKNLVERALEAELANHLGYDKYERQSERNNSRNRSSTKHLITDNGVSRVGNS
jgi:putative transposase